ncbi:spoT-like ppGpp hydrolase domain protein, partial [Orientia tsutsugamushi str. Gilliam]
RFHNIQTVSIKPYEKRQEIILETQQEFIPLAEYLKLPEIAIELINTVSFMLVRM